MTRPVKLKNPSVKELAEQVERLLEATRCAEANVAVQDIERRVARLEKQQAEEQEFESETEELLWPSISARKED